MLASFPCLRATKKQNRVSFPNLSWIAIYDSQIFDKEQRCGNKHSERLWDNFATSKSINLWLAVYSKRWVFIYMYRVKLYRRWLITDIRSIGKIKGRRWKMKDSVRKVTSSNGNKMLDRDRQSFLAIFSYYFIIYSRKSQSIHLISRSLLRTIINVICIACIKDNKQAVISDRDRRFRGPEVFEMKKPS